MGKAPNPIVNAAWIPPPLSHLKINSDASFFLDTNLACSGMVCRGHLGNWIEGQQLSTITSSAMEAELKAIMLALQWARRKNWFQCIISTDCLKVFKAITESNFIKKLPFLFD